MSENNQPYCSVCIANYNGENYLVECIESILSQKFNLTVEIIIHDDASNDNSVRLVKERYPEIIILESEKNVGFCISNNRMVDIAKGDYILLLNNDAFLYPDALESFYKKTKVNKDSIYGLPQYDAETGELIDCGSVFDPFLNPIPNKNRSIPEVGMIIGACLWVPKKLWVEVGGFPDWFETLAEDMFLCCCARLQGYTISCLPNSGFKHWVGKNLGGGKVLPGGKLETTIKRRSLSERNKTYVMIVCYPAIYLSLLLPLHLLILSIEGVLLSLVCWDRNVWKKIYWNCILSIFKNIGLLARMRRKVQSNRVISTLDFFKPFTFMPHKLKMLLLYGIPQIRGRDKFN